MARKATNVAVRITGEDRTKSAWHSVAARAAKVGKGLALGVSAAGAAMGAAAVATIDHLGTLSDLAVKAGMDFESFQKLVGAFGQAGIDIPMEAAADAMAKFNKALADPEKLKKLSRFGVDMQQFAGMSSRDAFMGFLGAVSKVNSENERLYLLQQALEEQGLKLGPLLRDGPEGLSRSLGYLMEQYPAVSNAAVAACDTAGKAWALTSARSKALWGEAVGWVLNKTADSFGGLDNAMAVLEATVYGSALQLGGSVSMIVGNFTAMWAGGLDNLSKGFDAFLAATWPKLYTFREALAGSIAVGIADIKSAFWDETELGRLSSQDLPDNLPWENRLLRKVQKFGAGMKVFPEGLWNLLTGEKSEAAKNVETAINDRLGSFDPHAMVENWRRISGAEMRVSEDVYAAARAKRDAYLKERLAFKRPNIDPEVTVAPPQLESVEKQIGAATSKGVRDGLAAGIEAGSYDALRTAWQAAASKARLAAPAVVPAAVIAAGAAAAAPGASAQAAVAASGWTAVNVSQALGLLTSLDRRLRTIGTV